MTDIPYEQEIIEQLRKLDEPQKKQVLDYMRGLSRPKGTPGVLAVKYAREIGFSSDDLAEMESAIEEWCEKSDQTCQVMLLQQNSNNFRRKI